ncbi:MAG TPA: Ig-like domain-containing protein, partial [Anaerolineales bacterium]|nr:Ig-like domain-containing protein [Anaerolineales bacterium]
VLYTSGPNLGTDTVTAMVVSNGLTGSTEIQIMDPEPAQITLSLSSNFAKPDGVSQVTLTATVTDKWGDPVPGQEVHIGVEGDVQLGTIEGGEVASGVTDANGQFSVVYTSGETMGVVGVRAELYFDQGNGLEVVDYDRKEIQLGSAVYLPIVKK